MCASARSRCCASGHVCTTSRTHPPSTLGRLQRYATDSAFENGWRFFEAGPDTGWSVGLVGGGPASLAAAHELRRFGHRCTLMSGEPHWAGSNTTGVAPYKMRADRALTEVDWILGIGGIRYVSQRGGCGSQHTYGTRGAARRGLCRRGPRGRLHARHPRRDAPRSARRAGWIERLKLGHVAMSGVARCGGRRRRKHGRGPAARQARGLGVEAVAVIHRGSEDAASAYEHELMAARREGVHALWRTTAVAFEGDGRLERVRCVRLDNQRQPIAGSEFVIGA